MKQGSLLIIFLLISPFIFSQTKTNGSPEECLKMKNISAVVPSPHDSKVLYTVLEAINGAQDPETNVEWFEKYIGNKKSF